MKRLEEGVGRILADRQRSGEVALPQPNSAGRTLSLTRAFRCALVRGALLRWMTPLLTAESMTGPAAFSFGGGFFLVARVPTALTTLLDGGAQLGTRQPRCWARRFTV